MEKEVYLILGSNGSVFFLTRNRRVQTSEKNVQILMQIFLPFRPYIKELYVRLKLLTSPLIWYQHYGGLSAINALYLHFKHSRVFLLLSIFFPGFIPRPR